MKHICLVTGVAFLVAAPAFAGPKDQGKLAMVGPQAITGNATVNNTTTAISVKTKGCKVQLGAKGLLGTADGDMIICIADADVIAPPSINPPGGGNGVVMVGETKAGALKIKADLTEIGCGSTASINFNSNLRCYLDDAAFRAPMGTWQAACAVNVGSIAIANPAIEPDMLKVNDTQNVIVGLCQNFTTVGARMDAPAAALIAVEGAYTALIVP